MIKQYEVWASKSLKEFYKKYPEEKENLNKKEVNTGKSYYLIINHVHQYETPDELAKSFFSFRKIALRLLEWKQY